MSDDADATEALAGFKRFPTWMWRNTDVVEFVEWLRAHNDALRQGATKTVGEHEKVTGALWYPRLERAIGVVYLPETERLSHYFHARLSDQFDAVVHFDETRAVEAPETFPFGV